MKKYDSYFKNLHLKKYEQELEIYNKAVQDSRVRYSMILFVTLSLIIGLFATISWKKYLTCQNDPDDKSIITSLILINSIPILVSFVSKV